MRIVVDIIDAAIAISVALVDVDGSAITLVDVFNVVVLVSEAESCCCC